MTYIEIFAIKANGDVVHYDDAPYSGNGAWTIWTKLAQKIGIPELGFPISESAVPVWENLGKEPFATWENIVLGSTFDTVVIMKPDMDLLVAALDRWLREYGGGPGLYTELKILERLQHDSEYIGCCFNQTSVAKNPWVSYNIFVDQEHWDLFDNHPDFRLFSTEQAPG